MPYKLIKYNGRLLSSGGFLIKWEFPSFVYYGGEIVTYGGEELEY